MKMRLERKTRSNRKHTEHTLTNSSDDLKQIKLKLGDDGASNKSTNSLP